jgi:hypothetical protein
MEKIAARILRRMRYKADSQGIIDRYISVSGAWDGHLQHTKDFILKSVSGKKIENLAVLGSGWLLDLPLDELSTMTRHVWLYDAIHPRQVIHRLQRYANVTAVVADITGGALIGAYQAVREYRKHGAKTAPEQLCNVTFRSDVQPDYIISLNILSQLGEIILNYLKRHVPYTPGEFDKITCLLQQSHLQLLQPGKSCLITDVKEYAYDNDDQLIETTEIIKCPLPSAVHTESWEWQFDPLKEYKPRNKTVSKIVAYEL